MARLRTTNVRWVGERSGGECAGHDVGEKRCWRNRCCHVTALHHSRGSVARIVHQTGSDRNTADYAARVTRMTAHEVQLASTSPPATSAR